MKNVLKLVKIGGLGDQFSPISPEKEGEISQNVPNSL